jgi:sugar phosphate isomerase/epimerase
MLAAQFYTVREFTKTREGFQEALRKVAAIGYPGVQLSAVGCMNGDSPEVTAKDARAMLDDLGLRCVATHRDVASIIGRTDAEIEFHETLGCDYAAIGGVRWPYGMAPESYRTFLREVKPAVDRLEAAGIRFGVHNHDFEFVREPATAKYCFDILVDEAPNIQLEVDTYWVQHAGIDPANLLGRLQGRIAAVHLKDKEVTEDAGPVMAPVGEGNLDWVRILESCRRGLTEYYIVEQDDYRRDPFDCLRSSFEFLKGFGL